MQTSVLLSFQGRASRGKFWSVFLISVFCIIFAPIVAKFLDIFFNFLSTPDVLIKTANFLGPLAIFIFFATKIISLLLPVVTYVLVFFISIETIVKRLHDRNKSGWWCLILLVPVLGILWIFIECGFLKGSSGVNNFGETETGRTTEHSSVVGISTKSKYDSVAITNKPVISIKFIISVILWFILVVTIMVPVLFVVLASLHIIS